jgi:hypothetical protein
MGKRDPGNKPSSGDRIPFVYIHNADKKALQGERVGLALARAAERAGAPAA